MNNEYANLEESWIADLLQESERDLIFLWHIAGGQYGGPKYSELELPGALERVTNELITRGCDVGFGDPGSSTWKPSAELLALENPGKAIAAGWFEDRHNYEFLVFSVRRKK
jgi:hypothetical protein